MSSYLQAKSIYQRANHSLRTSLARFHSRCLFLFPNPNYNIKLVSSSNFQSQKVNLQVQIKPWTFVSAWKKGSEPGRRGRPSHHRHRLGHARQLWTYSSKSGWRQRNYRHGKVSKNLISVSLHVIHLQLLSDQVFDCPWSLNTFGQQLR